MQKTLNINNCFKLKKCSLPSYISATIYNLIYFSCKSLRPCYKRMLDALLVDDEEPCVENVAIGSSTVSLPFSCKLYFI